MPFGEPLYSYFGVTVKLHARYSPPLFGIQRSASSLPFFLPSGTVRDSVSHFSRVHSSSVMRPDIVESTYESGISTPNTKSLARVTRYINSRRG